MHMNPEMKEMVFIYYQQTLNLQLAFDKLELAEDLRSEIQDDKEFMNRIAIQDATEYDNIITNIRDVAENGNMNLKLQANKELLKIFFGEDVYKKDKLNDKRRPSVIMLEGVYPQ